MNSEMSPQPMGISERILHRKRNASNIPFIVSTCLLLAAMTLYAGERTKEDFTAQFERDQQAIGKIVRQLDSPERARSDDPEVQLGLLLLYENCDFSPDVPDRAQACLKRVLGLDPNNQVAWAIQAGNAKGRALRMQMDLVDQLDRVIRVAQSYGGTHITIGGVGGVGAAGGQPPVPQSKLPPPRPLEKVFGDVNNPYRPVRIEEKDYDQARSKVRMEADKELNQAVKTVEEAEKHDPENALYNYLKANLYFELRQPDQAIRELQAGVRKPSIEPHFQQKQRAATKALETAGAPATLISHVKSRVSIGEQVNTSFWKQHVEPLLTKMEDEGNFDQAKQICDMGTGIAKQIREQPLPEESVSNAIASRQLERLATERSAAIDKRKAEKSKPPENEPQPQKK